MEMTKSDFFACIDTCFVKYNLPCPFTREQKEQYYIFTDFLLSENQKYNLTAIRTPEGVIETHIFDSITPSSLIKPGASVADIGTGAGFPTLPLAIFRPDITITAVDSTEKKLKFIESAANLVGIHNIITVFGRAEELSVAGSKYRDAFDVAIGRSVASLPILTELCAPFVKPGGIFIAMKSETALHEAKEAANALFCLNCKQNPDVTKPYTLSPETDKLLIVSNKRAVTPSKYPRAYAQIKKKPL